MTSEEASIVKLDISDEICSEKPSIADGFVTMQSLPGFGVNITDDIKIITINIFFLFKFFKYQC